MTKLYVYYNIFITFIMFCFILLGSISQLDNFLLYLGLNLINVVAVSVIRWRDRGEPMPGPQLPTYGSYLQATDKY